MIKKQQQFLIKGMNQDIAETKVQPELAHSIKNLRIITDEDSGMVSLVTEKGSLKKDSLANPGTDVINLTETFPIKPFKITVNINHVASVTDQTYIVGTFPPSTQADWHYSYSIERAEIKFYFEDGLPNPNRTEFIQWLDGTSNIYNNINLGVPNESGTGSDNARLELKKSVLGENPTKVYYEVYDYENTQLSDLVFVNDNTYYNTVTRDTTNKTITINIPVIFFDYGMKTTIPQIQSVAARATDLAKQYAQTLNFTYTRTCSIKNVIGSCVIKNDVVFFGKALENNSELDVIFKIKNFNASTPIIKGIYLGNLNFNVNNPIKTYLSYESENVQKIYWIDGLNQPRVINVANDKKYEMFDDDIDNHFNFCTPIYCEETVEIIKKSIGGFFHSGVIQYFTTYVDQNDQESKIFYQSPLYYITDNDRSLSPEENSTNSFVINLKNINANKLLRKKLRIYSLQRTSLDAAPVAKLVYELKLTSETDDLTVVDTGNVGSNIDAQVLLLLGCDEFIPKTFAVKDNNMFFGNIEVKNYQQIPKSIAERFMQNVAVATGKQTQIKVPTSYDSNFQLNGINPSNSDGNKNGSDAEIKGFMYNEEYMLGIQFLHKSGDWSEPIWVGDFIMTAAPSVISNYQYSPYFYRYFRYTYFTDLINLGYIAVRPLVVFNDQQNCKVLCQGIVNPTIKYKDNLYPSWFFRYPDVDNPNSPDAMAQWTDVQSEAQRFWSIGNYLNDNSTSGEVQGFNNLFSCFHGILTFNSPEVEFEKITTISNNAYKLKAIGFEAIHANTYDIEMLTSTSTKNTNSKYGLFVERDVAWGSNAKRTFVGGYCWKDKPENNDLKYYIFPWENNQSYTCCDKSDSDITYSAPERKIISNYRYSQYFKVKEDGSELNLSYIAIANQNYLKTKVEITGTDKEYAYIKDVDLLVTGSLENDNYFYSNNGEVNPTGSRSKPNCNVVRIQYKTTPHIILDGVGFIHNNTSGRDTDYANLLVCELINGAYDDNTKFKGRINNRPTETSMYENTWYIAGDIIKLPTSGEINIKWTKGDTYYQRYDCLKTYPYNHEAKNSIVDVLSCMIQTRINLDGRYDKNRCSDILHIDPNNFNKLNDVYSQADNFFTYHKLDSDRFQNTFSNLITWGKQKNFGESVDSWTNIHLVNTLDLNGALGDITALKLWNNRLLAFQQKGIALIKYNENSMIPQITGAPIELMNSGKVTGKEYLTNQFGCQNEWSIVNAKSGLYFSDDYNHKLYVLSDGIKCISDELGFKSYLKNKKYSGIWKPNRNAGITLRTYYDQQLGDIYFTDGTDCLTYNENLNLFTSFYDYVDISSTKLFDFINIENKNYWVLNDFTNNTTLFYEHRAINNLNIFGNNKGYEIELTSNIDPYVDKIFDTVEIRGDAYISNNLQSGYNIVEGVNTTSLPFDKLQVSNEYQDTGEQTLNFIKDKPYSSTSNMKQKFRIWRAAISRNKKNNQNTRDRIRNYWSRIKLIKTATNNLKAKIHDIIVNVYE